MIPAGDPIGLPGLAVLAAGFAAFLLALFAARMRAGAEADGNAARSRRSMLGIALQGAGFAVAAVGARTLALDPLSARALIEAALVGSLLAVALALFVWATRTMGADWSLVARTRSDHRLVDSGPFAHVRHPIYSALFLVMLAIAVALGHLAHLWLAVPLYAVGTWVRVGEEERLLRAKFPGRYDVYAARVSRFVPGVF